MQSWSKREAYTYASREYFNSLYYKTNNMKNYRENDLVIIRGSYIETINSLIGSKFIINGESYNTVDLSPVPIDNSDDIVIIDNFTVSPCIQIINLKIDSPDIHLTPTIDLLDALGLSHENANDCKDRMGYYWPLDEISKDFLKENNIKYIHELQRFLGKHKTSLSIEKRALSIL